MWALHLTPHARLSLPLLAALMLPACGANATAPGTPPAVPRLVLAFYYPWWGRADGPSGKWYHWNPDTPRHDVTDTPVLGLYDSNDTAVVRQHISWARAAGIDAFVSSWWGPGSFEDHSLQVLLAVAERLDFKVSIILESPFTADELRDDIHTLLATRATSPAWLRVNGRPVLFVYARIMNRFTPDDFRRAFAGTGAFTIADTEDPAQAAPFDGVFSYGPVQDLDGYLAAEPAEIAVHHAAGRIYVGAALPGYDDRVIRQPGRLIPRDSGAILRRMLTAAAGADWVTVTSWNEWHEGTEIEPSLEYGERYLELTRELGEAWRGRPGATLLTAQGAPIKAVGGRPARAPAPCDRPDSDHRRAHRVLLVGRVEVASSDQPGAERRERATLAVDCVSKSDGTSTEERSCFAASARIFGTSSACCAAARASRS